MNSSVDLVVLMLRGQAIELGKPEWDFPPPYHGEYKTYEYRDKDIGVYITLTLTVSGSDMPHHLEYHHVPTATICHLLEVGTITVQDVQEFVDVCDTIIRRKEQDNDNLV